MNGDYRDGHIYEYAANEIVAFAFNNHRAISRDFSETGVIRWLTVNSDDTLTVNASVDISTEPEWGTDELSQVKQLSPTRYAVTLNAKNFNDSSLLRRKFQIWDLNHATHTLTVAASLNLDDGDYYGENDVEILDNSTFLISEIVGDRVASLGELRGLKLRAHVVTLSGATLSISDTVQITEITTPIGWDPGQANPGETGIRASQIIGPFGAGKYLISWYETISPSNSDFAATRAVFGKVVEIPGFTFGTPGSKTTLTDAVGVDFPYTLIASNVSGDYRFLLASIDTERDDQHWVRAGQVSGTSITVGPVTYPMENFESGTETHSAIAVSQNRFLFTSELRDQVGGLDGVTDSRLGTALPPYLGLNWGFEPGLFFADRTTVEANSPSWQGFAAAMDTGTIYKFTDDNSGGWILPVQACTLWDHIVGLNAYSSILYEVKLPDSGVTLAPADLIVKQTNSGLMVTTQAATTNLTAGDIWDQALLKLQDGRIVILGKHWFDDQALLDSGTKTVIGDVLRNTP